MTTYRALKGYSIKSVTSDPANIKEGQIWYNDTSNQIKVAPLISAWASGEALQAAVRGNRMTGTQTAGLSAFGQKSPGVTAQSQEYDGTDWASNVNANTARGYMAAFGSQTASSFAGGYTGSGVSNTETYDGSSFSNGTALNTARWYCSGAGTNTAAVVFLGTSAGTEEWDGSSWTEVTNNPTSRRHGNGLGTQTAALAAGGLPNTATTSQEYDGTNWTSGGTLNTGRAYQAGFGILTAGLIVAGNANGSVTGATESYDGTSFATTASLGTGVMDGGGAGSSTSGVFAGGGPTHSSRTEEFSVAATTRTLDVS
jgi:hypothetical protein